MKKSSKLKLGSIRTKTTLFAVCIVVVTMAAATIIGTFSVKNLGDSTSEQMLRLLCETGEKNLDSYFESVEQSLNIVSERVKEDLEKTDPEDFGEHIERVRADFGKAAFRTNGVLTYYYRIDPEFSKTEKGFWYTNLDGEGFTEHEVTDITLYDTADTSSLVWFTVPKYLGESIWLPPYVSDNLDVRVISYNVPVYRDGEFVGVIGIEIDYSTMASEVNSIKLYENGYAFINDEEGNIIYHPQIDVTVMSDDERPKVPEGLIGTSTSVRYTYEGVEKLAARAKLVNGMFLNVTVPVSEINREWQKVVWLILLASAGLLVIFVVTAMRYTERITKPLRELTEAAEQVDAGNYDVILKYDENNEVGVLSRTFDRLISHLRVYISDLNSLANTDALTAVSNKGAFSVRIHELQQLINESADVPKFAIVIFDCDDLKLINDRYGHDKGDIYLKNTSALICHVFQRSPVFRIGGDEFAVVLQGDDFNDREELFSLLKKRCAQTCEEYTEWWDQVRVSFGAAVYDPAEDPSVDDVVRRADKLMYENKHARKAGR